MVKVRSIQLLQKQSNLEPSIYIKTAFIKTMFGMRVHKHISDHHESNKPIHKRSVRFVKESFWTVLWIDSLLK